MERRETESPDDDPGLAALLIKTVGDGGIGGLVDDTRPAMVPASLVA